MTEKNKKVSRDSKTSMDKKKHRQHNRLVAAPRGRINFQNIRREIVLLIFVSKRQNCCEVVGVCGEFGGRKMEEKAQTTWFRFTWFEVLCGGEYTSFKLGITYGSNERPH